MLINHDRRTTKKFWQLSGAVLLIDLSKGFDCLSHDLKIPKIHIYGVKEVSLNLLFFYLKNRKQRVPLKALINNILFCVLKGSIIHPLLFNIFLCELFLLLHDISVAKYVDGNTPYCTGIRISNILFKLENAAGTVVQWFKDNRMKANPNKYHLLINNSKESFQIKIGNETVTYSKYEKLPRVKIDHELNFNEHASSLCKKAKTNYSLTSSILHEIW